MAFFYCRNIYLSDTDAAGVLYFASGMSICHEAYEEWLIQQQISVQQIISEQKIALPIVHAEINFFQPIRCGDRLKIALEITQVTATSFVINYQVFKSSSSDNLLAKASTKHVCIDIQTRSKSSLPNQISQLI